MPARRASLCSSCKRPLTVHDVARGGTCTAHACRAAAEKARLAQQAAERERSQQARASALASQHLDGMLAERADLRARKVALVVLTGKDQRLARVAAARRAQLASHLRSTLAAIADAAPVADERDDARTPSLTALSELPAAPIAQTCTLCRGFCCSEGGATAYIEPATLMQARALHPELEDDALIGLYMDAIPARSTAGSCIFHGAHGCSLPRPLRARICNEFYCVPVNQWRMAAEAGRTPAAGVVVIRDDAVIRSALIEEGC